MTHYEVVHKPVVLSASRSDYGDAPTSSGVEELEVGEVYDEDELPDGVLDSFPERFSEVTVVDESDEDEDELPLPLDDLTNDEIAEELDDGDFTDDELQELIDYEESNQSRSGAVEHLESAL